MSKLEYWCSGKKHWARETRMQDYGWIAQVCEDCAKGDWDSYVFTVREVREPRYVAYLDDPGTWYVRDNTFARRVAYDLTEFQARELAELMEKWEEYK